LTLVIVSLEVPHKFSELMETMRGGVSFAICFALLFNIWNSQNVFFRRYGLTDSFTIFINAVLLFVVLIYTYPLKFLFMLLFSTPEHQATMINPGEIQTLMLIYSTGAITIYLLFFLMYRHAERWADHLALTPVELYETRTSKYINLICMGVCATAITIAIIAPHKAGMSGFVYCSFPIVYSTWFSYRGKRRRQLFPNG
jgi:uncharacterized membrane protein